MYCVRSQGEDERQTYPTRPCIYFSLFRTTSSVTGVPMVLQFSLVGVYDINFFEHDLPKFSSFRHLSSDYQLDSVTTSEVAGDDRSCLCSRSLQPLRRKNGKCLSAAILPRVHPALRAARYLSCSLLPLLLLFVWILNLSLSLAQVHTKQPPLLLLLRRKGLLLLPYRTVIFNVCVITF